METDVPRHAALVERGDDVRNPTCAHVLLLLVGNVGHMLGRRSHAIGVIVQLNTRGVFADLCSTYDDSALKPPQRCLSPLWWFLLRNLAFPEVEDEGCAVLLLGFDQDVVDVGFDGAHGKE